MGESVNKKQKQTPDISISVICYNSTAPIHSRPVSHLILHYWFSRNRGHALQAHSNKDSAALYSVELFMRQSLQIFIERSAFRYT